MIEEWFTVQTAGVAWFKSQLWRHTLCQIIGKNLVSSVKAKPVCQATANRLFHSQLPEISLIPTSLFVSPSQPWKKLSHVGEHPGCVVFCGRVLGCGISGVWTVIVSHRAVQTGTLLERLEELLMQDAIPRTNFNSLLHTRLFLWGNYFVGRAVYYGQLSWIVSAGV